jgi:hypothetical protein
MAKVRVSLGARNEDGYLLPGVVAKFVEGFDTHALVCHSPGAVGSIIGNAVKAAISKALRSAASRLGNVTGRALMRDRTDGQGKKQPWQNFTVNEWPVPPVLPYMGDRSGGAGFDAGKVLTDALNMGSDAYDTDDDGDAYDPHTGVVQQPAVQQAKRAPVEPAQAPQSAPVQQRQPTPPPAAQPAQQSEPAQAPVTSRPAWMSAADAERIANNDRIMRDDGFGFHAMQLEAGGVKIAAGCRWFTLAEFRAHVASQYPGTDKAVETLWIIDAIERRAADLGIALEPVTAEEAA